MIIFTSGTTGNAKGALLTHRSLVNAHKGFEEQIGLEKGSVWMNCTPLHTIAGCGLTPLSALWNAGTQLLLPRFHPELFFRAVEDGANWAPIVPTMGVKLLEHLQGSKLSGTSLKAITIGGAPIAPELAVELEEKLGAKICSIYGQSEAAAPVCQADPNVPIAVRARSAGKPCGGRELRIADPTTGRTMAFGETGEICIRGFVMSGYYGQPSETAAALDSEGWLHTGDLGELSADGELTITGRLKDMIISGGLNVYPREIEDLLMQHPTVAEAAVFGVPDPKWGEIVVAGVRLKDGAVFDATGLRQFVASRLARFKVPADFFAVDTFPLTASGKIQKPVLRDIYLQRR